MRIVILDMVGNQERDTLVFHELVVQYFDQFFGSSVCLCFWLVDLRLLNNTELCMLLAKADTSRKTPSGRGLTRCALSSKSFPFNRLSKLIHSAEMTSALERCSEEGLEFGHFDRFRGYRKGEQDRFTH